MNATTFLDLAEQVTIPEDGTISRTLYQDSGLKVVVFGFAAGQELSEHTSSSPAIMHFIQGEAQVTLDVVAPLLRECTPGVRQAESDEHLYRVLYHKKAE